MKQITCTNHLGSIDEFCSNCRVVDIKKGVTKNTPIADWEEYFDKKFGDFGHFNEHFKGVPMPEEMKAYIATLLAQYKTKLIERIEKRLPKRRIMVNPFSDSNLVIGYNSYRKEVKALLLTIKEEK